MRGGRSGRGRGEPTSYNNNSSASGSGSGTLYASTPSSAAATPLTSPPLTTPSSVATMPTNGSMILSSTSIASSPSSSTSTTTTASGALVCRVCYETRNASQVITCTACGVSVHRSCYRIKQMVDANDWQCNRCASGDDGVQCVLCPGRDGAFKRITDKRWCHLDCIRWYPESRVDRVPLSSWNASCHFCSSRHGAVVECLAAGCGITFHASCARQQRLLTIATPQARTAVTTPSRSNSSGTSSSGGNKRSVGHAHPHMAAYCANHAASHSQTRHTNGRLKSTPASPTSRGLPSPGGSSSSGITSVVAFPIASATPVGTSSTITTQHAASSSTSSALGLVEEEEDRVCSVCFNGDHEHGNDIVFCDRCDIGVHQSCYGIPRLPEGDWYCRRCERGVGRVRCVLCPFDEGAFKPTNDGRWVHVVCGLWIPGPSWGDTLLLEPLNNIAKINPQRYKLQCSICGISHGACIQCSANDCTVAFHPLCAQSSRCHMEVKEIRSSTPSTTATTAAITALPFSSNGGNDNDDYKLIAYCRKHSGGQPIEVGLRYLIIALLT
jgi:hypothetical protein